MVNKYSSPVGKKGFSIASYGFKDWLIQRVTAVIMVLFTVVLFFAYMFTGDDVVYMQWSSLFAHPVMQILTFLTFVSLCYHAWIGIRDIWMDYIKPVGLKLVLHVFTLLWLLGCAVYCAKILWRFA